MIVYKIRISLVSVLWLVTKSDFSGNKNFIRINPLCFPLKGSPHSRFCTNPIIFMQDKCFNRKYSIDGLIYNAGSAHPLPQFLLLSMCKAG